MSIYPDEDPGIMVRTRTPRRRIPQSREMLLPDEDQDMAPDLPPGLRSASSTDWGEATRLRALGTAGDPKVNALRQQKIAELESRADLAARGYHRAARAKEEYRGADIAAQGAETAGTQERTRLMRGLYPSMVGEAESKARGASTQAYYAPYMAEQDLAGKEAGVEGARITNRAQEAMILPRVQAMQADTEDVKQLRTELQQHRVLVARLLQMLASRGSAANPQDQVARALAGNAGLVDMTPERIHEYLDAFTGPSRATNQATAPTPLFPTAQTPLYPTAPTTRPSIPQITMKNVQATMKATGLTMEQVISRLAAKYGIPVDELVAMLKGGI